MKIEIPKLYRDRFREGIYITRWSDHALLCLDKDHYERVIVGLGKPRNGKISHADRQFIRLLKASVIEAKFQDGMIELPAGFETWLIGSERTHKDTPRGLTLN